MDRQLPYYYICNEGVPLLSPVFISTLPLNQQVPPAKATSNIASTYCGNIFRENSIKKHGGYPWIRGRHYNCNRNALMRLHEEIVDFCTYITPTNGELNVRLNVINKIKFVILNVLENTLVDIFGSFPTNSCLPTSDLDIVVIGQWEELPFSVLCDALVSADICSSHRVVVLPNAEVPLIKIADKLTDIKVDISFNAVKGIEAVQYVKNAFNHFSVLRSLVLIIKQFLVQRNLHEVFHGGLSSYGIILMCINFLQGNARRDYKISDSIAQILLNFLTYYGQIFEYRTSKIAVDNGILCTKSKQHYGGHQSLLCIEDPLNVHNDVGRKSFAIMKIKNAFYDASWSLRNAIKLYDNGTQMASILGSIIQVSDNVIDYREFLKQFYQRIPSKIYDKRFVLIGPDVFHWIHQLTTTKAVGQ